MERGAEQGTQADTAARRTAQLLTSHVLMLALDEEQAVQDCAVEVARVSRGDLSTLYEVHERVRRLASEHPGVRSERALTIVDAAIGRVDSLHRHPSSEPLIDLRVRR